MMAVELSMVSKTPRLFNKTPITSPKRNKKKLLMEELTMEKS
jgi:hypothetical protein